MSLTREQVLQALRMVRHPETRQDIVEMGIVEDLAVDGHNIQFNLKFKKPKEPFSASLKKTAEAAIKKADSQAVVEIHTLTPPPVQQTEENPLADVSDIIAVASGKGGVGKSTVAVNLAVALAKTGARVGLIDADVYGPSIPKMFGLEGQRPAIRHDGEKEWIIPIEKYGVRLMSIGFFVSPEDAVVWRGPMATGALRQLISQTDWGKLDYLLLDLPPGTGDIHLTIVQEMAVTGAVIISTPQEVALADAVKGIAMFTGEKINVPVLGLVENMAWFTPAELPQNKYYLFGKEGVKKLAEKMKVRLLGQIPIVAGVCEDGDGGTPSALDESGPAGKAFHDLAASLKEAIKIRNSTQSPTQKVKITTMNPGH